MSSNSLAILFLAVILFGSWVSGAWGHGDAAWIAAEPRYVDSAGAHCCGVTDCMRERATMFREEADGIHIVTESGSYLSMPRSLVGRGLYPSINDDWWICVRAGVVRCIFKPTSGM